MASCCWTSRRPTLNHCSDVGNYSKHKFDHYFHLFTFSTRVLNLRWILNLCNGIHPSHTHINPFSGTMHTPLLTYWCHEKIREHSHRQHLWSIFFVVACATAPITVVGKIPISRPIRIKYEKSMASVNYTTTMHNRSVSLACCLLWTLYQITMVTLIYF